MLSLVLIKN